MNPAHEELPLACCEAIYGDELVVIAVPRECTARAAEALTESR